MSSTCISFDNNDTVKNLAFIWVFVGYISHFKKILSPHPDTSLHCETMDMSLVHGVHIYGPVFAGTHCAYLRRDGQAELTWVAGYVSR